MSFLFLRATVAVVLAASILWPTRAQAHDASAWGGLFRSGDGGLSWFQASAGKVMGGALALAIDPGDPTHLLLGTDSGLLVSTNGGRDWELAAATLLKGPVLAVSFDRDGRTILAATSSTAAESDDGVNWRSRALPLNASPPRALVPATGSDGFYLVGWSRLFHTEDGGETWSERAVDLPGPVTRLVVRDGNPQQLYALSNGDIWQSRDGGHAWQQRTSALPPGRVQALALTPGSSSGIWAGAENRLLHSQDDGETWAAVGQPLPDANTDIRGIAAQIHDDPSRIVMSTDRGLYASRDGGMNWSLLVDNLPGHIEAGPLVRVGGQSDALYAGFSVTPYRELWDSAAAGSTALARLSASEIAGAVALLTMLVLGAVVALRWLAGRS